MTEGNMIVIRQTAIEDKKAIITFLKKTYKDLARYKFPERCE